MYVHFIRHFKMTSQVSIKKTTKKIAVQKSIFFEYAKNVS